MSKKKAEAQEDLALSLREIEDNLSIGLKIDRVTYDSYSNKYGPKEVTFVAVIGPVNKDNVDTAKAHAEKNLYPPEILPFTYDVTVYDLYEQRGKTKQFVGSFYGESFVKEMSKRTTVPAPNTKGNEEITLYFIWPIVTLKRHLAAGISTPLPNRSDNLFYVHPRRIDTGSTKMKYLSESKRLDIQEWQRLYSGVWTKTNTDEEE